jgi:hypothetical protein
MGSFDRRPAYPTSRRERQARARPNYGRGSFRGSSGHRLGLGAYGGAVYDPEGT